MCATPRISDAEWLIMKVVWQNWPTTATEVIEALASESTWKPKTVMTLLTRLVKKGALAYQRKGRAYEYYPLVQQADCTKAESRSFLDRVYDGALKPMLADFLEQVELSEEEIAEIKQILDKGENR